MCSKTLSTGMKIMLLALRVLKCVLLMLEAAITAKLFKKAAYYVTGIFNQVRGC